MSLQKQSLSKRSRGFCAICLTAPSLPRSPNKLVKGLTDIFPMRKMAVLEICTADLNACVISATSLWMERSFLHYTEELEEKKMSRLFNT